MNNIVSWIMNHNTLLYSIFFAILLVIAFVLIARYYIVNKPFKDFKYLAPLVITLILFVYSFEQISFGHLYKVLSFNTFTFYCLLAYLYHGKIKKRVIADVAFWFILASSLLALLLCVFPAFKTYFIYGERFAGIFGNPNTLQFCSAIVLAVTLTLYFRHHISRWTMYFHSLVLIALGLSTCSKTFMILLVVLLVAYLVYEFIYSPKVAFIELGVLALTLGTTYLIWGKDIIEYIKNRISPDNAGSFINGLTTYRWDLWVDYLGFWAVDPWAMLFGRGMSSPDFILGGTHNDYIFILYNLGVVGTALLLWLAVTYLVIALKNKDKFNIWNLLPIFTCLAISMTENLLIRAFALLIVFSLMFVFDGEQYEKKNSEAVPIDIVTAEHEAETEADKQPDNKMDNLPADKQKTNKKTSKNVNKSRRR